MKTALYPIWLYMYNVVANKKTKFLSNSYFVSFPNIEHAIF